MSLSFSALGNAANAFVLTSSLAYAGVVVYFTRPGENLGGSFLDDDWKADGFCIANKDVPYWSSFDTCLYVDTLFSFLLSILYFRWRKLPGMKRSSELIPMVVLGTLAHGLAHGVMAAKKLRGVEADDTGEQRGLSFVGNLAFCFLFWFPLLKASMFRVPSPYVATMAVAATFGPVLCGGLRQEHGFAYIQTVLSIAFHTSQICLPSEHKLVREYVSLPLLVSLSVFVAWNEAFFCQTYIRAAGGHVLYDASIIIGYILYYIDCYRCNVLNSKEVEKKTS